MRARLAWRLYFVSVAAVLGACGGEPVALDALTSTNISALEAGAPPAPTYTNTVLDSVTGDNGTTVVMGTSANCPVGAPCYLPDPQSAGGGKVDSYYYDVYERPTAKGSSATKYYPSIDIVSSDTGVTSTWLFYRINLFGTESNVASQALPHFYSVEVNFDNDPQGDAIIEI